METDEMEIMEMSELVDSPALLEQSDTTSDIAPSKGNSEGEAPRGLPDSAISTNGQTSMTNASMGDETRVMTQTTKEENMKVSTTAANCGDVVQEGDEGTATNSGDISTFMKRPQNSDKSPLATFHNLFSQLHGSIPAVFTRVEFALIIVVAVLIVTLNHRHQQEKSWETHEQRHEQRLDQIQSAVADLKLKMEELGKGDKRGGKDGDGNNSSTPLIPPTDPQDSQSLEGSGAFFLATIAELELRVEEIEKRFLASGKNAQMDDHKHGRREMIIESKETSDSPMQIDAIPPLEKAQHFSFPEPVWMWATLFTRPWWYAAEMLGTIQAFSRIAELYPETLRKTKVQKGAALVFGISAILFPAFLTIGAGISVVYASPAPLVCALLFYICAFGTGIVVFCALECIFRKASNNNNNNNNNTNNNNNNNNNNNHNSSKQTAGTPQSSPKVFFDITIGGLAAGRVVFKLSTDSELAETFRRLCTGEKKVDVNGTPLYYKGNKFHRLYPGYSVQASDIQGGDIDGSFAGYTNLKYSMKYAEAGTLIMYNMPTVAFCITTSNTRIVWDDRFIIVGKVDNGMDVLKKIETQGSVSGPASKDVVIADCGQLS